MNSIVGWYQGFKVADSDESKQQYAIGGSNINCLQTPYRSYQSDANLAIDGTVCKSGDVLLRVANERGETAFYWVSKDKLKERIRFSAEELAKAAKKTAAAAPPANIQPASWSGGTATMRPTLAYAGSASLTGPSPYLYYVQDQVVVLCTQRIDDRHVRQRIRRQDGCFDQIIDLANGAVVSVSSAPCTC